MPTADRNHPDRTVRWVSTTERSAWAAQPALLPGTVTSMPNVFIDTTKSAQLIEGFGVAFNELGWTSLAHLESSSRDDILRELFAPGVGANLTMGRMPVGANDFSRDWYSYDEHDGDFALERFSIENDLETLVPFIRAAQAKQPALTIWASPWSPPSWMKTNSHYAGAMPFPGFSQVENGLTPEQVGHEGTDMFRVDDERYLDVYARYFGRFVDAYAELGIPISMVMPQNEFNSAQVFPSCTWTPEGLARFLRFLGPEMQARGVEIFLGTLERSNPDLVDGVLADPVAAEIVRGVGVQWHGKHAMRFLRRDHPQLRLFQTEQECGDGRNDWRFARYAWELMRNFLNDGASAYIYWNLSLLEGGVSRWGWAQNSLVTVNPESGEYAYTHEYQLLKHVSHFVRPGAHLLPSLSYTGFENQIVFQNPDGEVVIVIQNDASIDQRLDLMIDGEVITPVLPADSFNTLVVPPSAGTAVA